MHRRSLSSSPPIGLDLSARALCAVQLSSWRRDAPVAAAVRLPRAEPREVVGAAELRRFREILQRQGFRGRSIVLNVPPHHLMTEVLQVRGLDDTSIDAIVRNELAGMHRMDAGAFELAHWALPAQRTGQSATTVMAVACKHDAANAYADLFESAGFEICGLDVHAWALARAWAGGLTQATGGALAIDLGWDGAQVAVLHEGTVLYSRTLGDSALRDVHQSLSSALDLDKDMTDFLLDEVGLATSADAAQVEPEVLPEVHGHLSGYLDKLESEIRRSIVYTHHEYPDTKMERINVVGEGAAVPGLVARLGDALGVPMETGALEDLAECREGAGRYGRSPVLAMALGLARYPKG